MITVRGLVATLYLLAVAAFIVGVFTRAFSNLGDEYEYLEFVGSLVCAVAWMTATVSAVIDVSARARRRNRTHAADHEG